MFRNRVQDTSDPCLQNRNIFFVILKINYQNIGISNKWHYGSRSTERRKLCVPFLLTSSEYVFWNCAMITFGKCHHICMKMAKFTNDNFKDYQYRRTSINHCHESRIIFQENIMCVCICVTNILYYNKKIKGEKYQKKMYSHTLMTCVKNMFTL